MGQAVTRWVWLPAPVVTRQATFKIHDGNLQQHPVPLRAARWYQIERRLVGVVRSTPVTPAQYTAIQALAAQALGPGQVGIQSVPQYPVMTRGTMIRFHSVS